MAKAKRVHYVDNKKLLQAMIEWKEFCVLENLEKVSDFGFVNRSSF